MRPFSQLLLLTGYIRAVQLTVNVLADHEPQFMERPLELLVAGG
jgi:hypothetical protein